MVVRLGEKQLWLYCWGEEAVVVMLAEKKLWL